MTTHKTGHIDLSTERTAGARDTIFALASGSPPAGVAVIRISGSSVRSVVQAMIGELPPPRRADLRTIRHPLDGAEIDRGLFIFFAKPRSFTGEDVAELHLHGGRAVIGAALAALGSFPGLRVAEPGEFTRRAFENGRIDLTEVEGLGDLIAAETELQRRQALRLAEGGFTRRAEGWRAALLRARAAVEADLDFSDEDDVPGSIADVAIAEAMTLRKEITAVLADEGRGERIREGFKVAISGPPNAGKSSLFNALARRDAAIVTAVPGTTRDIVEVRLDLAGASVVLADTAGLRDSDDIVEIEGIRRARAWAEAADLVLWLTENGAPPPWATGEGPPIVELRTKADLHLVAPRLAIVEGEFPASISVLTGDGISALESALAVAAGSAAGGEPPLITRVRHRRILEHIVRDLSEIRPDVPAEIRAEALRRAGDGLARLVGRMDVEDVLGVIFSSFCIGK